MATFSKASLQKLSTCHPDLQRLFLEVIKVADCTIICGHRSKEDQDKAVAAKLSKTPYPKSKHNSLPSRAVDVMPSPIDWNDLERVAKFAEVVKQKATELKINIRWGGDWNENGSWKDEKFYDGPHYELKD